MKKTLLITLTIMCISSVPIYAVTQDMVLVPGGWFPYQNTEPKIFISTFLIDKFETTNELYCQFLNDADPNSEHWVSDMNSEISRSGSPDNYEFTVQAGREKYPIRYVSFYDANAFAQWKSSVEGATYRLPTEQEWEKAAAWDPIEPNYYLYGFHKNTIDCNWCNYNNCNTGPMEVGSYNGTGDKNDAKSFYGCYDMSGNVYEWTSSVLSGTNGILRGGHWGNTSYYVQCFVRNAEEWSGHSEDNGFRLVREEVLSVKAPNGGENWMAGTTQTISWEIWDANIIPRVRLEYSINNGIDYNDVNSTIPNNGSYQWLIPNKNSNQCLVRISDVNNANVFDISDSTFIIFECQLNSKADLDNNCKVDFTDFALFANDWLRNGNPFDENYTEPLPIIWVYINDPGVSGHEGFTGYMSKYETTNSQYCQFLNSAKASGDITIDGNNVLGASGSNSGEDFVGQVYYNLAGPGYTYNEAPNGGAARINYNNGAFTVDSGFENHPVTYVTWYGAQAFCNYFGWRLPTEWEWQAVADYDGSYNYGCGTNINNNIANYYGSIHPEGTTIVGAFGTYGYEMCDMAGNLWEWTSSIYSPDNYVIRGGNWGEPTTNCLVTSRGGVLPWDTTGHGLGFRLVREIE